jgi:hypothetical protein
MADATSVITIIAAAVTNKSMRLMRYLLFSCNPHWVADHFLRQS